MLIQENTGRLHKFTNDANSLYNNHATILKGAFRVVYDWNCLEVGGWCTATSAISLFASCHEAFWWQIILAAWAEQCYCFERKVKIQSRSYSQLWGVKLPNIPCKIFRLKHDLHICVMVHRFTNIHWETKINLASFVF